MIGNSCSLPVVLNTLDKMKAMVTCNFFINSAKQESLAEVAKKEGHRFGKRKVLIDVCRTRWAAQHNVYSHFYTAHVFIVKALEVHV